MATPYDEFQAPAVGTNPYADFQQPAPPQPSAHPWLDAAADVATGIGKGAMSTVFHAADPLNRAFGLERRIQRPEVQAGITPTNTAQKVGMGVEQAAEFLAPTGIIGKAGKAVDAATAGLKYGPVARVLGKAAVSGATSGLVAGAQTGGDPTAMKDAAIAGAGTTGALSAVGEAAAPLASGLKESAQKGYARALGPTTQENKLLTEKQVAPGLIDRGVTAWSRKGLQSKIAASVQDFGQQVGNAIAALPPDASLPADKVLKAIDDSAAKQFLLQAPTGKMIQATAETSGMDTVENLKNILKSGITKDAQGNDVIDSRFLRSLRQSWDELVAKGKGFTTNDLVNNSKLAAYRSASGAIREEFSKEYPDIAALNKHYSFWKNAEQVIDATVNRTQSQAKPMSQQIVRGAAAGAGLITGGPGKAILDAKAADALMQATQSPAWRTVSAVKKDQLANFLLKGDMDNVAKIASGIAASQSFPPPAAQPRQVMPPPGTPQ